MSPERAATPAQAASAEAEVGPEWRKRISRRAALFGAGAVGLGIGALAGGVGGLALQRGGEAPSANEPPAGASAEGGARGNELPGQDARFQAGVSVPAQPQRHALITVADVDLSALGAALPALGEAIDALHRSPDPALLPDGAADLSVLVGLGERALAALWNEDDAAALLRMPQFKGDDTVPAHRLGGDVLLSVNASDPQVLEPVLARLRGYLPGFTVRWSEHGFRGPGEDGIVRNPFGYHDGVVVPRTEEELHENVWIDGGPLSDGTVCVIRHFALDTAAFGALDLSAQDRVFGRERVSGAPLSGGQLRTDPNVAAKSESGELLIPGDSHLHAAHPSFTGSALMLRRSYSGLLAAEGGAEPRSTLIFTAFQRDIKTFVATQQRMDDIDALSRFVEPTATAAFAILPGYDATRPLGSTLLGAPNLEEAA